MIRRLIAATCLVAAPAAALLAQVHPLPRLVPSDSVERHLKNVTQLTDGGENAESYFSHDGKWLALGNLPERQEDLPWEGRRSP